MLRKTTAILALGLFTTTFPASMADSDGSELIPTTAGPGTGTRLTYTYGLDLSGWTEDVARTGVVTVPIAQEKAVTLTLAPFNIFVPGGDRVITLGTNGQVVADEPMQGKLYRGKVAGADLSYAVLDVSPTGLYGAIIHEGKEYSIQPIGMAGDLFLEEVAWYLGPPVVPPKSPTGAGPDTISYQLIYKAYGETSFINYVPNGGWTDRIMTAYGYAATMWESETNTQVAMNTVVNAGRDFTSDASCGGSDNGLGQFRSWLSLSAGINAYGLFHAADGNINVVGCAGIRCDTQQIYGCLQNANTGTLDRRASHAVQGKDWYWTDIYNPNDIVHLSKILHQELTHNAGEPDHPTNGNWPCDYNIMDNDVQINCRQFWRVPGTTSTVHKVKYYGQPRFYHL
jgi:hypothetical protein